MLDLVGNPEDRFSCNAAQMSNTKAFTVINLKRYDYYDRLKNKENEILKEYVSSL